MLFVLFISFYFNLDILKEATSKQQQQQHKNHVSFGIRLKQWQFLEQGTQNYDESVVSINASVLFLFPFNCCTHGVYKYHIIICMAIFFL